MTDEFEVRMPKQMSNIPLRSREEIIHTDNFISFTEQSITQMAPQETRSSSYQYSHNSNSLQVTI